MNSRATAPGLAFGAPWDDTWQGGRVEALFDTSVWPTQPIPKPHVVGRGESAPICAEIRKNHRIRGQAKAMKS